MYFDYCYASVLNKSAKANKCLPIYLSLLGRREGHQYPQSSADHYSFSHSSILFHSLNTREPPNRRPIATTLGSIARHYLNTHDNPAFTLSYTLPHSPLDIPTYAHAHASHCRLPGIQRRSWNSVPYPRCGSIRG